MRRMRTARLLVAVVAASATVTAGCGRGSGTTAIGGGDLPRLATARSLEPRRFTASSVSAGHRLVIEGVVEDDYRYAASVTLDDTLVYEEVVADDTRYVRVADPTALLPVELVPELLAASPEFTALLGGSWVVDPVGAPVEFTSGAKPLEIPLAPRLVLDRIRYLETLPELLKGGDVREYNTDAIYYLPKDDKFPEHKADGKRYDHVPSAYDPNAVTVTLSSMRKFFEYFSVWADSDGVNRVERVLALPDPDDGKYDELYGQVTRAGSRRLQALVSLGERGRKLTESYVVDAAREGEVVTEPAQATPVDLGALLTALAQRLAGGVSTNPLYGPVE